MARTFKSIGLNKQFVYNSRVFVKVETVYKDGNCCIPEYNAYSVDDETDRILVPLMTLVEAI